jgi:transposase
MDREPRPRVRQEKGALRRLIRLVESNSEWVLGYEDETWWSRFEQPSLHSWAEAGEPMRLLQKEAKKDDPDPKALSCYGLYLPELERTWLRFVDGRPVSAISTQFLSWSCQKLEELGKKALVLVWDNASWHKSKFVREWIAAHNREVRERGSGVRIVPCFLPKKSPWLNAIEPKWVLGKRNVVEPDLVLTAHELADTVCEVFGCTHEPHLPIPQEVA